MRCPPLFRLATALLLLGGLAACTADSQARQPDKITIVVGFYPLRFITERIAGPGVTVTTLAKPGAEPHDLELSPRQVTEIADAALVVYLKGFQPAVDTAVSQQAADTAFDVAGVEPLLSGTDGHDHDGAEPSPEPGAAKDPHVWLDPTRLATIADRLAERLAAVLGRTTPGTATSGTGRGATTPGTSPGPAGPTTPGSTTPGGAGDLWTRAASLRADLEALDREYQAGLRTCQRRELVVSHAAFGYLAHRYGLEQIAITGLTPEEEPSAQRLAEIAREAREHGATTIFFETLVSPKVAEAIAREVGARTAVLDPIEGLSPDATGDYLSVMRANLATLRTALGCT